MKRLTNREACNSFLSQAFQCPRGQTFFDDFPIWKVHDEARLFGYENPKQQIVCTGGIRVASMKSLSFRVALIGGIATAPEVRGQGFASRITKDLLDLAVEEKCHLAVLWGSEWSLYSRLGFEPAGVQQRIPLSRFMGLSDESGLGIQEGWNPAIFELMMKRPGGIELEPQDASWVGAHKNTRWFWIGEQQAPRAYAAYGRGIDLTGMIHEWGGEAHELVQLLSGLNEILPNTTEILGNPSVWPSPAWNDWVSKTEVLCLMNRIDFPKEQDDLLWFWGLDAI